MPVEGDGGMDLFGIAPALTLDGLGAVAALAAGVASSPHCAVMCGPLACAAAAPAARVTTIDTAPAWRRRWGVPGAYHAGRIAAYGVVGAALGLAGEGARQLLTGMAPVMPWVMAGALVATAFGVGKRLPIPVSLRRLAQPIVRRSAGFSPLARSAALGAATPLLPCAALYALFIAAVAASSILGAAALMMAFALGATPALALVQAHAPLLQRHPRAVAVLRRAVPLLAAAVLVWRAVQASEGSAPPTCH